MQPQQPYGNAPAPLGANEYEFITNPNKPDRRGLGLGNSMPQRLLIVLGSLFVLLIIVLFVVKLLSHTTNIVPALTAVAQQQQELIHLTSSSEGTSTGGNAPTLSADHQNVQATIQLVLASNQSALLNYLSINHYKVKSTLITGYASSTLDQQLTTAAANGTYDSTFASIIQSQLDSYQTSLKQAYVQVTGPKGRALLSSDYNQAQLLQQQLTSPAS